MNDTDDVSISLDTGFKGVLSLQTFQGRAKMVPRVLFQGAGTSIRRVRRPTYVGQPYEKLTREARQKRRKEMSMPITRRESPVCSSIFLVPPLRFSSRLSRRATAGPATSYIYPCKLIVIGHYARGAPSCCSAARKLHWLLLRFTNERSLTTRAVNAARAAAPRVRLIMNMTSNLTVTPLHRIVRADLMHIMRHYVGRYLYYARTLVALRLSHGCGCRAALHAYVSDNYSNASQIATGFISATIRIIDGLETVSSVF